MDLAEATLQGICRDYSRALDTTGSDAPPGFSCMGKDMLVDQLRRVIITPGTSACWRELEGKWYVCNDTPLACLYLSSAIGATRFLPAEGFVSILERLCAGEPWQPVSETELAMFLNLVVAESFVCSDVELTIWVTVAHELSSQRGKTDIHELLPALITDHDVLCDPGRPKVRFSEKLEPGASTTFNGTLGQYREQLFATVLSDLPPHGPAERRLRAYVRDVIFSQIALNLG
jgi:hypothetical protein